MFKKKLFAMTRQHMGKLIKEMRMIYCNLWGFLLLSFLFRHDLGINFFWWKTICDEDLLLTYESFIGYACLINLIFYFIELSWLMKYVYDIYTTEINKFLLTLIIKILNFLVKCLYKWKLWQKLKFENNKLWLLLYTKTSKNKKHS